MFARRMALMLVAGALAASVSAMSPASASYTNSCTGAELRAGEQGVSYSCTATGQFHYYAATLNAWQISVKRGIYTILTVKSGSATGGTGTLPTSKGDVVTTTVYPSCTAYGCVEGGAMILGDNP